MRKRKDRFLIFLCCVLAVPTCGVLTGKLVLPSDPLSQPALELLAPWVSVGTILGLAHLLLRPILRFLTAPLGCLTFGLFGLVIDVALIYASAAFIPAFELPGLLYALLTALLINTADSIIRCR